MASVMTGGVSGVTLDSNVLGFTLTNVTTVLDKINEIVFFGTMDTNTRTSLQTFLSAATLTSTRIRDAYGLALSSPQWQWY